MNPKSFLSPITAVILGAALMGIPVSQAIAFTTAPLTLAGINASQSHYETVAFSDSAEAGMLRRAYVILATGDHDYKGHRVKAMHAVESAGRLLGLDLSGDLKDKSPQPLSDERLREAQGLIDKVLASAAVKVQKRVTRHLNEAVKQIDLALAVR